MKSNQRQQILAHDHQTKSKLCVPPTQLAEAWEPQITGGKELSPLLFVGGARGVGGLWSVAPTHTSLLYDSTPTPFHHPSNKTQPGLAFGFGHTGYSAMTGTHMVIGSLPCGLYRRISPKVLELSLAY